MQNTKPPRYLTLTVSPEENLLERIPLIEKVLSLLQSKDYRWLVIHGESGLGKTTLANACFHEADKRNLFAQFGWINFTTNLPKSIVKAVSTWEPKGSPSKNEAFYEQAALEEVLQLRNYETSQLIVLDGVADEKSILDHLDLLEIRQAKVLITTRLPSTDPRFLNFRIPPLEDGDVLHFFSKAGLDSRIFTPDQLKAIKGNPWLLRLLTAQIPKASEKAAKDFVQQVFTRMPAGENLTLALAEGLFEAAPLNAAACWLLLQFAALPPGQYDLETLVAYLSESGLQVPDSASANEQAPQEEEEEVGEEDLDITELKGYRRFAQDWPQDTEREKIQLSELVAELVLQGWLSDLEGEYAIHDNTIQLLKIRRLNDAAYFPELCNCFSINYFTKQNKRLKDNLQYESHLLCWLGFVEAGGSDGYLGVLDKLITFYEETVDYHLEVACRLKYLQLAEATQSEDVIIRRMASLAENYRRLGELNIARQYAEKALESASKLSDTRLLGSCQNELGLIMSDLGQYDRARDLLKAALAVAVKNFGPEHLNVAVQQSNLALVYDSLGQYDRARGLLEAALEATVKNFGPEHPNVSVRQSNLANVYDSLGQYDRARDLFEEALEATVKNFGPEHPNVAVNQSNLANVYDSLGQYDRARDLLEAALAADLKNFGPDHPNVAVRQSNLANVYRNLEQYDRARDLFEAALEVTVKNFGPDHPNVAVSQSNLANVYYSWGQYNRARDLLEAALAADLKNFGPDHPNVAIDQISLGAVFAQTGEKEKAKDTFEQAYLLLKKQVGEQHPNTKNAKQWLDSVS